jgi:hypothetical protein
MGCCHSSACRKCGISRYYYGYPTKSCRIHEFNEKGLCKRGCGQVYHEEYLTIEGLNPEDQETVNTLNNTQHKRLICSENCYHDFD